MAFLSAAGFKTPYQLGNQARLLVDGGPFFEALLSAILEAEFYVFLESYIVVSDHVGWQVAEAIAAASSRGVEVAFCYDGFGSLKLDASFLNFLKSAGIKTLCYRPPSFSKRVWPWSRRDHRKMLVVDGKIGLVGGMNIAAEYASKAQGGEGWRDTAVRVEGPAVRDLESIFRALWARHGRQKLESAPRYEENASGTNRVAFLGNFGRRERAFVRREYLRVFSSAKKHIRIENAYFVPDRALLRALIKARSRGVKVEVIVARATDVPIAFYATRALYGKLLRAGVRIFEWHDRVLHAKTAVVDGRWATVGSSNLDYLSSFRNLEVNASFLDSPICRLFESQFDQDRSLALEVEPELWRMRSLGARFVDLILRLVRALVY